MALSECTRFRTILLWIARFVFLFGLCIPVDAKTPQVLIIHSYHEGLTWVQEINLGLARTLQSVNDLSYHYLDTKRIPRDQFADKAKTALGFYKALKPDVVVLCDDNALDLLGETIARDTPIVFCGINGSIRDDYPELIGLANVTGVLERPLIQRTVIEMSLATGINATNALILLGDSPTARAFYKNDLKSQDYLKIGSRLNIYVKRAASFSEWQQVVMESRLQGYDFIVAAGFYALQDDNSKPVHVDMVHEWLHEHASIPVFSTHSQSIGEHKAAGGMVVSGVLMGQDAGQMVLQVLEKDFPERRIPFITQSKGELIFSKSALRRWNLSLKPEYFKRSVIVP